MNLLRTSILLASTIPLAACAGALRFVPQGEFAAAVAVEARNGANCAQQEQEGRPISLRRTVLVEYARIAFDVIAAPTQSESANNGLSRARDITNRECGITPTPPSPQP